MSESEPDEPEVPDLSEYDRSAVADELREAMDEALHNGVNGRVRDAENERVRVKWLRAFTAAATEYRQQISEIEEEAQERRIENLEERVDALDSSGAES
jgi:hypothetical protein